jgi:hypothetical protein
VPPFGAAMSPSLTLRLAVTTAQLGMSNPLQSGRAAFRRCRASRPLHWASRWAPPQAEPPHCRGVLWHPAPCATWAALARSDAAVCPMPPVQGPATRRHQRLCCPDVLVVLCVPASYQQLRRCGRGSARDLPGSFLGSSMSADCADWLHQQFISGGVCVRLSCGTSASNRTPAVTVVVLALLYAVSGGRHSASCPTCCVVPVHPPC